MLCLNQDVEEGIFKETHFETVAFILVSWEKYTPEQIRKPYLTEVYDGSIK